VTPRGRSVRIERQGARVEVHGELTFATVPGISPGSTLFPDGEPMWEADLTGVTRADSAGLALLVEWLREARRRGAELRIVQVPDQLLAIARVSGVAQLLSLAGEAKPSAEAT
jgi:phospholipid transport system transporter-binding protein